MLTNFTMSVQAIILYNYFENCNHGNVTFKITDNEL